MIHPAGYASASSSGAKAAAGVGAVPLGGGEERLVVVGDENVDCVVEEDVVVVCEFFGGVALVADRGEQRVRDVGLGQAPTVALVAKETGAHASFWQLGSLSREEGFLWGSGG